MKINAEEITSLLKKKIQEINTDSVLEEVGVLKFLGDGVATIYGLENVTFGELLEFEFGVRGIVLNLNENSIDAIILDDYKKLCEGQKVKRTKKAISISVCDNIIGRVVDVLGNPIDGRGAILGEKIDMPFERNAPGVIFRQPVNIPLQTGIKNIDALIPIGRGQRELIIGDRQTGKTTIAIDTIINQKKFYEEGKPIYCIYVGIGQKKSSLAYIVNDLNNHGAMEYTTVISAPASSSAGMQVYAPFAGMAIGEYFRDQGKHALVIFDDLSKQSIAYREISLLLKRPPGREAFPGDVFYLHSRLLERAAMIISNDTVAKSMNNVPINFKDKIKGGGSLTALPIIETQAGDVSAYIPTNVISITDGQIFLESNLFNSGIRPAVNVGISVSRVGGAAQTKAMKKVAGRLKLSQAQFRELEAFSKFGSDLDSATKQVIDRGKRNQEVLKQNQHELFPLSEQVVIIYLSTNGFFDKVELKNVKAVEKKFLDLFKVKHSKIMKDLENGIWDDSFSEVIEKEFNIFIS